MDQGYKIQRAFLDISKELDKVWHKSPFFKLKKNGVFGKL